MTTHGIVWTEGMFIAPQHFQHSDMAMRAYADAVAQLPLAAGDHGVSELEINLDALNIGKFALRHAAGVFPDRAFFRLSEELVIDIPDGCVGETVYLALPLAVYGAAQVGAPGERTRLSKRLTELRDIAEPGNAPIEAELAELGACLLRGSEDLAGFATIPVARVLEKDSDGRVVLDRRFMPCALCLGAAPRLGERLEEIISLARQRAANAATRVTSDIETRSEASLLTERLELLTLNRWLVVLQNAAATPRFAPRALHAALAQLLVELEALVGSEADPELLFNPLDLGTCFEPLIAGLRRRLTLERQSDVVALDWNSELFEKRRLLRVVVPARHLAENRRLVLAVTAPEGARVLTEMVPLAAKLAGLSAMPELVTRGLPGIELRPMTTAPGELRMRADAAFFEVNTASSLWKQFVDKREALALHVDSRIPALEATLYLLG
jgi:type VI secretion system protein ImpJ